MRNRIALLVLPLAFAAPVVFGAPPQAVSPSVARAWAADIHSFFASSTPDLAAIQRPLAAMAGLDLSDPKMQKRLAPLTRQIQAETQAVLRQPPAPSDPRLAVDALKLRILTQTLLDQHLSTADQLRARQALASYRDLLTDRKRRQLERRFAQISRALDGEALEAYVPDHAFEVEHKNAARLAAAHEYFRAAGVPVAAVRYGEAFYQKHVDRRGDFSDYISVDVPQRQLAKAQAALASLPGGAIADVEVEISPLDDDLADQTIKAKRETASAALAVRNHLRAANVNVTKVNFYSHDRNYNGGTGDYDSPFFVAMVPRVDYERALRSLPYPREIAGIEVSIAPSNSPLDNSSR